MQFTPSSGEYFNSGFIDTLAINALYNLTAGFDIVFWVDDSLD